jgi:UDP-N-acetylmuramoyl-L-alanyl-D-glutamate--2,6-diaminopimelate ligase
MMILTELLKGITDIHLIGEKDCVIEGIAFDSRKVLPGYLFAALPGSTVDGHRFIAAAIANGAKAVLCEQLPLNPGNNMIWIKAPNTSLTFGQIASNFYGNPSSAMKIVGITGTNGKTTTATLLYRLFKELGYKAGLLSTVCNYVDNKKITATHTTPDPLQIQELMSEMVETGCTCCFMEVSSHAIDQQRTAGINFDGILPMTILTTIKHLMNTAMPRKNSLIIWVPELLLSLTSTIKTGCSCFRILQPESLPMQ